MTPEHPKVNYGKTGILIVNLGTPDSTKWLDIRKYLKEFLSDRRVIEVNPIIWQIILNVIILNLRPSKTAKAYKEIWMKKKNMSPLRYYTLTQAKKLSKKLNVELGEKILILYYDTNSKPKIRNLKVVGQFDTGISEFDNKIIISYIESQLIFELVNELNLELISHLPRINVITVKTSDFNGINELVETLQNNVNVKQAYIDIDRQELKPR